MVSYYPVWLCCCCCNGPGSWKKGHSPPVPREYGSWPFHLLIPCHCRYCGFWRSCSLIILMACDSPLALAIFALACASATTVWFAITCMALKLFCSVRYFWNATTFLFNLICKGLREFEICYKHCLDNYIPMRKSIAYSICYYTLCCLSFSYKLLSIELSNTCFNWLLDCWSDYSIRIVGSSWNIAFASLGSIW